MLTVPTSVYKVFDESSLHYYIPIRFLAQICPLIATLFPPYLIPVVDIRTTTQECSQYVDVSTCRGFDKGSAPLLHLIQRRDWYFIITFIKNAE